MACLRPLLLTFSILLVSGCGSDDTTEETKKKLPADAFNVTSPNLYLWEIKSDTATIYLTGSIHLGIPELQPLPKKILEAFDKSDKILIEADPADLDASTSQRLVRRYGTWSGTTLSKELSPKTLKLLKEFCSKHDVPLETMERLKPWMVVSMISVKAFEEYDFNVQEPLDKHYTDKARKAGKRVLAMESMEEQVQLLASRPTSFQDHYLQQSLMSVDDIEKELTQMLSAWVNGDLEKMNELLRKGLEKESPELKDFFRELIDDRNVKMVSKIDRHLQGKDTVFVVVGSAHVPGEKGILKLLEDKGYQITQVKRK